MKADPRFPDRPTSPDFDVLALAAQQLDEEIEHDDIPTVTNRICDIDCVHYMVNNRLGAAFGPLLAVLPSHLAALVQSGWMDGFAIGARYQRNGGKPHARADIHADAKPPVAAPFDTSNPLYLKALETFASAVVNDVPMENVERLFGVCCGVATVLVPAVYQTKQLPPENIADEVCAQVIYDMQEKVRSWDS